MKKAVLAVVVVVAILCTAAFVIISKRPRWLVGITIYLGRDADELEHRECVLLANQNQWVCSGTLVGRNALLTAAHCFRDHGPLKILYIGRNPADQNAKRMYIDVSQLVPEAAPTVGSQGLDVQALMLPCDVGDSMVPTPPVLATTAEIDSAEGKELTIVGFGGRSATGQSRGIKRVGLIVMAHAYCDPLATSLNCKCVSGHLMEAHGKLSLLQQQGVCIGDSGGPIYVPTPNGPKLAAIASCFRDDNDDCSAAQNLYVRTDKIENWITRLPNYHPWTNKPVNTVCQ